MLKKKKDHAVFEEELIDFKREHYKRISELVDENTELKKQIKALEHGYELNILSLKQQLLMETERASLEATRLEIQLKADSKTALMEEKDKVRDRELGLTTRVLETVCGSVKKETKYLEVKTSDTRGE